MATNDLWNVGINTIGKGGVTLKHDRQLVERARVLLKAKPRYYTDKEAAEAFFNKLPDEVRAITHVYSFIFI